MPRKGQNIYKRKDGRWEGRYVLCRDPFGKIKYGYVYAKTYTEVKERLTEQKSKLVHQQNDRKNITYAEILDRWLSAEGISVRNSTCEQYRKLIDNDIKPYLGRYQMRDLSTELIENHIIFLLRSGRKDGHGGLSPKSVNDILTVIKSSVRYSKSMNYWTPCEPGQIKVRSKSPDMRVLSRDEQRRLMRVLSTNIDRYKLGVILSLYTGLRIGELCALKWKNIDLENAVLTVNETLQRIRSDTKESAKTKIVITPPKSEKSVREIPLPLFIVSIAKSFYTSPDDFVLSGQPDKFVEPRVMQYRFKKYVKEAEIGDANFHALRHTFATRCVECGFEIKSLSEILGHAGVAITLNRYVHSSMDLKRQNMNKLEATYIISPSK